MFYYEMNCIPACSIATTRSDKKDDDYRTQQLQLQYTIAHKFQVHNSKTIIDLCGYGFSLNR